MRNHSLKFVSLAAALVTATSVLAMPNVSNSAPAGFGHADEPPGEHRTGPRNDQRAQGMAGAERYFNRPGVRSDRPAVPIGLEIAARLSALEVYVGIRSDQEDAWRRYTSSLIGLFDSPMPMPPEGGQARGENQEDSQQSENAPTTPALLSERLANDVIARGETARDLQEAIAELRTTLDSAQLTRLAAIEPSLAALPGPGGPDHPRMKGLGTDGMDRDDRGPRPTPPSPSDR